MKASGTKMITNSAMPTSIRAEKPKNPQPSAVKKTAAMVMNPVLVSLHCVRIRAVINDCTFESFRKLASGYCATAKRSINEVCLKI